MPPVNAPKYTPEQRAAVAHAVEDRGMAPADVARAAAAGTLPYEDRVLEPFEMPAASVSTYALRLRNQRRGRAVGQLAEQPPRDAVEILRRRLVNLADRELGALERKKVGTVEPERLRQTARAVREIAALPAPTDPTPAAPGQRVNGTQTGGQTRGGKVGALLADHRAEHGKGTPAPNQQPHGEAQTPEPSTTQAETHNAAHEPEPADTTQNHSDAGALVRALAARVNAGAQGDASSS